MNKTRVVKVERIFKHPLYEKVIKRYKKYYVHDELNQSKNGDVVEIMSTRPLSKLKRWRIYRIITKKAGE
jgi:small subunit ribosomal protein S17